MTALFLTVHCTQPDVLFSYIPLVPVADVHLLVPGKMLMCGRDRMLCSFQPAEARDLLLTCYVPDTAADRKVFGKPNDFTESHRITDLSVFFF